MTFRLHPTGGVCNRVRAILSYRAAHGAVAVEWDNALPRHFNDLFHSITGVVFVDGYEGKEDCGICADAPAGWERAYALLQPVPAISQRIAKHRAEMGHEYVAIHVRRTDMIPLVLSQGLTLPTDEDFHAWLRLNPTLPAWVATDNGETQRKFTGDPRVRVLAPLEGQELHAWDDHTCYSPLEDGVVDLFMCAYATHWMGSGAFGSFSNTIEILRRLM